MKHNAIKSNHPSSQHQQLQARSKGKQDQKQSNKRESRYEVMQNKWEHTHTPTNTYINLRSQTYNLKISVSSKNKAFM